MPENEKEADVWHYTTLAAFKEIVKSKSLRATRTDFLNDYEEIDRGTSEFVDFFNKQLRKYQETSSQSPLDQNKCVSLRKFMKTI